MIRSVEQVSKDQVQQIERKLEKCRNQANNPDSREYKRAMQAHDNEDIDPKVKYAKLSEEMSSINNAYLNPSSSNRAIF